VRFHSLVRENEGHAHAIHDDLFLHDGPACLGGQAVVEIEQRQHHRQDDEQDHHRYNHKAHIDPHRYQGTYRDWRHHPQPVVGKEHGAQVAHIGAGGYLAVRYGHVRF